MTAWFTGWSTCYSDVPRITATQAKLGKTSTEGYSINKLQNSITPLIFKMWKIRNIHLVGSLIWDTDWNFYEDNVITVTLVVLGKQSVWYFACQFSSTTRQILQANLFKLPTLSSFFNTSLKFLQTLFPGHNVWQKWQLRSSHHRNMATRSFTINVTICRLLTPKMHCWSRKTLVTINWMHIKVNVTCAKSFWLQKTNNRMLFFMVSNRKELFRRQRRHI